MGEYAKALGLIMAVEQEGFSAVPNRTLEAGLLEGAGTSIPSSEPQLLTDQVARASVLALDILSDAATLDALQSKHSRIIQTTGGEDVDGLSTTVLEWAASPESLQAASINQPWGGNNDATVSIEVNPHRQTVAVLRKVPEQVLPVNREMSDIMLGAFTKQPRLLLPAVARALNATLHPHQR
jgi:hypothetical protein